MSPEEHERRMVFARKEVIKALPTVDEISKRDAELAEEFAKILVVHMYQPHLGCATTGQLLQEVKARVDLDYKCLTNGE